jgi:hypothetical protein
LLLSQKVPCSFFNILSHVTDSLQRSQARIAM